jgi:NADPH2:quinone reductase
VIAGAGGVGAIAIQLAKHAGFEVTAAASRQETVDWCRSMGADAVIDHRKPLASQLAALGHAPIDVMRNFSDPAPYWQAMGELLAPQGHVGLIVEPSSPLNLGDPYKAKCIGIHWEMMFARARFKTADRIEQHRLLNRVSSMIDAGDLRTTHTETVGAIDAANLRETHRRLESGTTIGKLVLAGWN